MGYETRFEINVNALIDDEIHYGNEYSALIAKVLNRIEEISDYKLYGGHEISGTWYDHRKHLNAVSIEFPQVEIHLRGEGEEQGDVWEKKFRNGKMSVSKQMTSMTPFSEFE